jgi:hypothetical protein
MSSEGSGHKHYRYRAESDMTTFLLTLERPPAEQLTHYGRAQKYAVLKLSAQRIREQLMVWIQERGLADGVARVGEPTVFNTLFVTSTPGVARELSHAPGVVDVRPAEDFKVDLFDAGDEGEAEQE